MDNSTLVTLLEFSCLFNFILIFGLIGVAKSREELEIQVKNMKRKILSIKNDVRKW